MPIVTRAGEVDAVDRLEEPVDEVLAGLLAVAHDVDAGRRLLAERDQHRVAPWPRRAPDPTGSRAPTARGASRATRRFGKATGDRGRGACRVSSRTDAGVSKETSTAVVPAGYTFERSACGPFEIERDDAEVSTCISPTNA